MTFTASSLADPDGGSIIAVEWSFGDGATASGTSVSHAYSTPGQKTVTMTITDSSGETTQVSHTLRVNAPPTASFTVAPSVPTSGSKVTFSASGSSDPDGSIASYAWEVYQRQFDGTYPSSPTFTRSGVSFDNTFYIPGLYKVRLSVTDSDGEAAATERVVRVNSFAFEINFFWEPPSPLVGEEVTFTGVALDAPDDAPIPFTGYRWDLDNDGRFGEGPGQVPGSTLGEIGPKVKRRFDAPGNYTVRLKVTDADGVESPQVATKTVTVVVTRPVAGFSFAPADPLPGQPVAFNSTSTPTAGKSIEKIEWDFTYDGATFTPDATGPSATHAYPTPGAKTVAVRATESGGGFDVKSGTIVVNAPPGASFSIAPQSPFAGDSVTFSSTASDPDGPLAAQSWDLNGDGSFGDAVGAVAARAFSVGTHTVRLRVVDSKGAVAVAARTFEVAARPLTVLQGVTVTISGRLTSNSTRLRRLLVRAPAGAKIEVRCRGRGCPKRSGRGTGNGKPMRFPRFERALRPRAKITVTVTRPGFIGKVVTFTMRRGRQPARGELCLWPSAQRAASCLG